MRQAEYLEHMLSAIRLVRTYTAGLSKADFLNDTKTQQAVILNILVIGEAATKLADEHPEIFSHRIGHHAVEMACAADRDDATNPGMPSERGCDRFCDIELDCNAEHVRRQSLALEDLGGDKRVNERDAREDRIAVLEQELERDRAPTDDSAQFHASVFLAQIFRRQREVSRVCETRNIDELGENLEIGARESRPKRGIGNGHARKLSAVGIDHQSGRSRLRRGAHCGGEWDQSRDQKQSHVENRSDHGGAPPNHRFDLLEQRFAIVKAAMNRTLNLTIITVRRRGKTCPWRSRPHRAHGYWTKVQYLGPGRTKYTFAAA